MINVGLVGANGYTGLELLRILSQHSEVNKIFFSTRSTEKDKTKQLIHSFSSKKDLYPVTSKSNDLDKCDVVFFATPHGVAMKQAAHLLKEGVKVIDLSADFRLKNPSDFKKWYGLDNPEKKLLKDAVYGLPELYRNKIETSNLVAMPGCYPTAVILGFLPLLKQSMIDPSSLIADCKSGISGAGKTPQDGNIFTEVSENFKAYGLAGHRHWPEIYQELQGLLLNNAKQTAKNLGILFSPHLVPMIRGIQATLYCKLKKSFLDTDIQKLYEKTYISEPFVDILPEGVDPETSSVRGLNTVKIAIRKPQIDKTSTSSYLVIYVVEDNLVKGASGQAVQVMNIMFKLKEKTGLDLFPLVP